MKRSGPSERAAFPRDGVVVGLLAVLGVLTFGTGLYFLAVRPAMLPEDFRFTGMTPAQLPPRMSVWLEIVFRTWGGFTAGFGVVLIGVAAYLFTARKVLLYWATAASLIVAFGRFLVSNLALGSDYLVFIAVLFGLAIVTAGGLILSSGPDNRR